MAHLFLSAAFFSSLLASLDAVDPAERAAHTYTSAYSAGFIRSFYIHPLLSGEMEEREERKKVLQHLCVGSQVERIEFG
jgi:hypothetical protein